MNPDTNRLIRCWVPIAGVVAMALVFFVRLFMLQSGLSKSKLKDFNTSFNKASQGLRGGIYANNGAVFAKSIIEWEYRLDSVEAQKSGTNSNIRITSDERMWRIEELSKRLNIPKMKLFNACANLQNRYQLLAIDNDHENYVYFTTNHFNALKIIERQRRVYPLGDRACHIVGAVSRDTNRVGVAGVEARYEDHLRGVVGSISGLKRRDGKKDIPGMLSNYGGTLADIHSGRDIYLTIDPNIQLHVEKTLQTGLDACRAESAWAIVMEVKTGAILAMASIPNFSPEHVADPENMRNLAVTYVYEPGSVMKTITACAALSEKLVNPETLINTARNDPRYSYLPGDIGHAWEPLMSVRESLVHSSNIVFGKLGCDVGPERLWRYMNNFGLGNLTGIDLPGDQRGILRPWKKWDKLKKSRMPIGQGVSVTALQLVMAYACIGNDGELLRPYVMDRIIDSNEEDEDKRVQNKHPKEPIRKVISPLVAAQVRDMLTGVAKKGGTAWRAAIPGYSVAGKTGTAQIWKNFWEWPQDQRDEVIAKARAKYALRLERENQRLAKLQAKLRRRRSRVVEPPTIIFAHTNIVHGFKIIKTVDSNNKTNIFNEARELRIPSGKYSQTEYNATFVGLVPASKPAIVVLVTFHKPYFCRSKEVSAQAGVPVFNHQGGRCAAPVFKDISTMVVQYLGIEPDIPEEIISKYPDVSEEEGLDVEPNQINEDLNLNDEIEEE